MDRNKFAVSFVYWIKKKNLCLEFKDARDNCLEFREARGN